MRILACTTAGTGHFLPMLPVLGSCAAAGHDVVVACPASFASTVTGAGFAVAPFDDAASEDWGAVMSRLPGLPPGEANRIVVREVFGRINTAAALPRLSARFQQERPELVVRDPSEFASWVLAQRWGVPTARVSISLLSLEPRWAEAAIDGIRDMAGPEGALDGAALAAGHVFAAAPATFDPAGDTVEVHRYRDPPPLDSDPAPLPEGDAPLVYVTLGTVAASLGVWPGTYRAILEGLEELSVRVLVTTGSQVDPSDLGALSGGSHRHPFRPAGRRARARRGHGGPRRFRHRARGAAGRRADGARPALRRPVLQRRACRRGRSRRRAADLVRPARGAR